MKLECGIEKIKNAVLSADRVSGKNLTLPILGSLLLSAQDKNLKIKSTNLSVGIEVDIPVKVEKEGVVAISSKHLSGVFSGIDQGGNLLLESFGGNVSLKTKRSNIKLKGEPADDFPTIPKVEGVSFIIKISDFIEGLKSVYYSSAVSDIKPEISSVYVYTQDEYLVFVSTDSFRLAEKRIKVKNIPEVPGMIIPFKNIPEILRVLGEGGGEVEICFNKNQISFSFGDTYLTSRLIDGNFPDYGQIIPKENKTQATLLKEDLLNTLKLSNVFADKFNQVNLKISPKEKVFEISSSNTDVGENQTQLEASLEGEDVSLNFNYKYFLDCFQSINSDSVLIQLLGPSKPIVIKGVSDRTFLYLVMPMNR